MQPSLDQTSTHQYIISFQRSGSKVWIKSFRKVWIGGLDRRSGSCVGTGLDPDLTFWAAAIYLMSLLLKRSSGRGSGVQAIKAGKACMLQVLLVSWLCTERVGHMPPKRSIVAPYRTICLWLDATSTIRFQQFQPCLRCLVRMLGHFGAMHFAKCRGHLCNINGTWWRAAFRGAILDKSCQIKSIWMKQETMKLYR